MTLRKILALTCLLLPMMASAHQFETGQRVPPIGITDRGELVLDKDQFSYKTWNSAQLVGKVRVLQHIAGRTSAKEKNLRSRSAAVIHVVENPTERSTSPLSCGLRTLAGTMAVP